MLSFGDITGAIAHDDGTDRRGKIVWLGLMALAIALVVSYTHVLFPINYTLNDAYVYLSYARSLADTGKIFDLTVMPKAAPITTQIGVALIEALVMKAGVAKDIYVLWIVEALLVLNLLFMFYCLYRISRDVGLPPWVARLLSLAFSISWYFYGYFTAPLNDGFFASLFLAGLCLAVGKLKREEGYGIKDYLALFLLGYAIPMFRLQGAVVFAVIFLMLAIKKKIKPAAIVACIGSVDLLLVKLTVGLAISDNSGISALAADTLSMYNLKTFLKTLSDVFAVAIPGIFLNFPAYRFQEKLGSLPLQVLSAVVLGGCVAAGVIAWRRKLWSGVALLFSIVLSVFMLFAFPAAVIDRYVFICMPLMYILALSILTDKWRVRAVLLIVCFSVLTIGMRVGLKNTSYAGNRTNAAAISEKAGADYSLISQYARQTYFLIGKPSQAGLNSLEGKTVVIVGDDAFIQERLAAIKPAAGIETKDLGIGWYFGDEGISGKIKTYLVGAK